jgi:hypothetical protein
MITASSPFALHSCPNVLLTGEVAIDSWWRMDWHLPAGSAHSQLAVRVQVVLVGSVVHPTQDPAASNQPQTRSPVASSLASHVTFDVKVLWQDEQIL